MNYSTSSVDVEDLCILMKERRIRYFYLAKLFKMCISATLWTHDQIYAETQVIFNDEFDGRSDLKAKLANVDCYWCRRGAHAIWEVAFDGIHNVPTFKIIKLFSAKSRIKQQILLWCWKFWKTLSIQHATGSTFFFSLQGLLHSLFNWYGLMNTVSTTRRT